MLLSVAQSTVLVVAGWHPSLLPHTKEVKGIRNVPDNNLYIDQNAVIYTGVYKVFID